MFQYFCIVRSSYRTTSIRRCRRQNKSFFLTLIRSFRNDKQHKNGNRNVILYKRNFA